MSSACVCHTDEWCFYCNMYSPLEEKYERQRVEIDRVIDDLEKLKNDPNGVIGDLFDSGFDCGVNAAQERLREVIAIESDHTGNTPKP